MIRLREVADLPPTASGPNLVNRENVRRRQTIRCNVAGRDLGTTVTEIERRVRERVKLPEGYFVEFGGQFEAQRSATRLIAVLAGVSVAGIFLVLMMLFPSPRNTLQILNAIPTAFIGGVVALVLTRQTLTVASVVGFVSLGGSFALPKKPACCFVAQSSIEGGRDWSSISETKSRLMKN